MPHRAPPRPLLLACIVLAGLCVVVVCAMASAPGALVMVPEAPAATERASNHAHASVHKEAPTGTPPPTFSKTSNAFRCQRSIESLTSFSAKDAKGFHIQAQDAPGTPGLRNSNCMMDFLEVINASFSIDCHRPSEGDDSRKDGCYAKIKFHARVPDEFNAEDSLFPTLADEARFDLRLENLMPGDAAAESAAATADGTAADKIMSSQRNAIHYKGSKEDATTGDHAGYSVCCALLDAPYRDCEWEVKEETPDQDRSKRLLPTSCGIHELKRKQVEKNGDAETISVGVDEDGEDELGLNAITKLYKKKLEVIKARKLAEMEGRHAQESERTPEPAAPTTAPGDVNEVKGYHIVSGTVEKPLHREMAGIWKAELSFIRAPLLAKGATAIADSHPSYSDMPIKSGKAGRITFSVTLTEEEMGSTRGLP